MAIWKQITVCLLLLAGALAAWVHFDPLAGARLNSLGIDNSLVAAIAPEKKSSAQGSRRNPSRRGIVESGALVVTREVGHATLNNRLKAIGSGIAIRTATITPSDSGTLSAVEVKAGDRVEAGEVIARLDPQAQQIAADQARLALQDAQKKLARYRELGTSAAVSSVQISDQESQVAADKLALKQAEYELSKRTIRAPIGGVIGIIAVNVGDYVTSQTQLSTIDDRSRILVDFQVPERFSGAVRQGTEVDASASAFPGRTFKGTVSAIDNRVDPDSRTLRVRAEIPNDEDLLRAGMSFLVTLHFAGERYPAVDPLSVQWDSNGAYVWKIVDNKAERVNVKVVQRNPQTILVEGGVAAGDQVVTQGVQVLRSGSPVRIADRERTSQHQSGMTGKPGEQTVVKNAAAL